MMVVPHNFAAGYGASEQGLLMAVVVRDLRPISDAAAAPVPDRIAVLLASLDASPGGPAA